MTPSQTPASTSAAGTAPSPGLACKPVLLFGILLWVVGTVAVRAEGQHILQRNRPAYTIVLYLLSLVLMALLVRRILYRLGLERDSWPAAATLLMLPTLILDPFSCLFYQTVFPNLDPGTAGLFGGWMLIFCAGAVAGVWFKR